jgi:hypothetical protein
MIDYKGSFQGRDTADSKRIIGLSVQSTEIDSSNLPLFKVKYKGNVLSHVKVVNCGNCTQCQL